MELNPKPIELNPPRSSPAFFSPQNSNASTGTSQSKSTEDVDRLTHKALSRSSSQEASRKTKRLHSEEKGSCSKKHRHNLPDQLAERAAFMEGVYGSSLAISKKRYQSLMNRPLTSSAASQSATCFSHIFSEVTLYF